MRPIRAKGDRKLAGSIAGRLVSIAVPALLVLAFASPRSPVAAVGGVWTPVDPAGGDAVHSVAVSGGAVLGGTYYNGLYRIYGGGTTQPPSAAAPLAAIARNPASPSSLAAGSWFEGVFTSADGGVTWVPDAVGPAAVDVYSLAWAGPDLFAGTSAGAFYRAAGGWEARSSGLGARNVLALLALPPVPPDTAWTLVAGTEHGLFRSTDKGLTWSPAGAVPGDVAVHSLAWAGRPAVIVAGSERGIYRSADAGLSWAAAAGPGAVPVPSLAAAHVLVPGAATVSGVFFAGTAGGAFISEDGGLTWSPFGTGLAGEARKVLSLAVVCSSVITVYAGTGEGIWQNSFDPPAGNADCDGFTDGDGYPDGLEAACGSDYLLTTSVPERIDGAFAGVDDDGDTTIDEALPGGAANFDCDGDGYKGSAENGTPLCGNGKNDDDKVGVALIADDAVIDDGCPGGPAQAGAFSEAQFNIGGNDQDPCGLASWPSDFVSGGAPNSTNKINVTDFTSFIAPPAVRRLNTAPGQPAFDKRWDLSPGRGVFTPMINVTDLTSLIAGTSGNPPMLGGVRAFNGPTCPWPP